MDFTNVEKIWILTGLTCSFDFVTVLWIKCNFAFRSILLDELNTNKSAASLLDDFTNLLGIRVKVCHGIKSVGVE